nr:hypothetical protein [uncultured Romboutsia sp.]
MINKLNELDLDIKRCETVLRENNYLEIVIAIEELHDKYKNTIYSVSNISSNIVWNYSKKDIENIQNYLKEYKDELIFKEKQKNIDEKIKDLRIYIEENDILEKPNLIEVINFIEDINDDLSLDEKWNKLKECLELIKNQERKIGTQLLEIIVLVSK